MRRTLLLLGIFLLLGAAAAWYFTNKEDSKTTLMGADRKFAVKDISQVHKIFLADRNGNTTTLERQGDHWIYNGKYKARPTIVRPLLEAIQGIEIKYKPPRNAERNIVKSLSTEGIKVELYDKAGEQLKAYYIGGATIDERGTYIIMDGAEQPYIGYLPSWEGNLSVRFADKGDEWRDKMLFAEEVENIQSVSVEYPKQRSQSFILEHTAGEYEVRPFYDVTPAINRPNKEGSAEAFLTNFEGLSAEAFRNRHPGRDSILQTIPFSIVTLVNKQNDTARVQFFPIVPETIVTQDDKSGEFVTSSTYIERYFADVNGEDFLLAQHLLVKKIFWGYGSFFQDDNLLN